MASKFVIKKKKASLYWQLLDTNGIIVTASTRFFQSEADCRQNISAVKKAAQKFTKVEVEADDDNS